MVRKTKYFHNVKAITPWNKSLVTIALKNTNLHENRNSQEADIKQAPDFVDARKIYILGVVFTDYSHWIQETTGSSRKNQVNTGEEVYSYNKLFWYLMLYSFFMFC